MGTCGVGNQGDPLVQAEVLCVAVGDPQSCAAQRALHFPKETAPVLMPIPHERSMPNPCAGVPDNPWCEEGSQSSQGSNAQVSTSTRGAMNAADLRTVAADSKRAVD
jgi:hypothetical protein